MARISFCCLLKQIAPPHTHTHTHYPMPALYLAITHSVRPAFDVSDLSFSLTKNPGYCLALFEVAKSSQLSQTSTIMIPSTPVVHCHEDLPYQHWYADNRVFSWCQKHPWGKGVSACKISGSRFTFLECLFQFSSSYDFCRSPPPPRLLFLRISGQIYTHLENEHTIDEFLFRRLFAEVFYCIKALSMQMRLTVHAQVNK